MSDASEPYYFEDLWDDDLTGGPKEEPNCGECCDRGCKVCAPTRFQVWCHRFVWRRRGRWREWRWSRKATPEDPPF